MSTTYGALETCLSVRQTFSTFIRYKLNMQIVKHILKLFGALNGLAPVARAALAAVPSAARRLGIPLPEFVLRVGIRRKGGPSSLSRPIVGYIRFSLGVSRLRLRCIGIADTSGKKQANCEVRAGGVSPE